MVVGQVILVGVHAEFGLESAYALLEADDVLAADLLTLGGVEILADGAGAFAREAAREGGIASRFPLQGAGVRERWFSRMDSSSQPAAWLSSPTEPGPMQSIARSADARRWGWHAQHIHMATRTYLTATATRREGVRYAMRALALAVLVAGWPMTDRHTRRRRRRWRRLVGVWESGLVRA